MKRSQAISVIEVLLRVLPDNASNRDKACAILNNIENFMCPSYQVEYGTGHADEYGNEQTVRVWSNQWEPEDENT